MKMHPITRKSILAILLMLAAVTVFAQSTGRRIALVVGNSNYKELGNLKNPGNDAADMAVALKGLGFETELLIDADLVAMEDAVSRLGSKLAGIQGAVGFFYYAGHGVQSGGTNYLIPADARISSESYLRTKALPVPAVLDTIQQAKGALTVVVLDACRDNPFSWARSGSARGLTVVGTQPTGSIVVYATGAGSVARDGTGRNGMFTQELLKQLGQPGVEIGEIFKQTGKAVTAATNGNQVPAIYSQFFESYYLRLDQSGGDEGIAQSGGVGTHPNPSSGPRMTVSLSYGSIFVTSRSKGTLYLDGTTMGELPADTEARLDEILVGEHELWIRYTSSQDETRRVSVERDGVLRVAFSGPIPPPATTTSTSTMIPAMPDSGLMPMILVEGGSFMMMGSESGSPYEKSVHNLSPFYIGKYEVTQAQFRSVTGINPSYFTSGGDEEKRPVEQVSWNDAVDFCNKLSDQEELSQVYSISGSTVTADFSQNGYRLPTEAEWEYAARGGKQSKGYTYSGSNDIEQVAWYGGNSGSMTHVVGTKVANELGLYDMSGNVFEWCNDWYDSSYHRKSPQDNPTGVSSGGERVLNGGSWQQRAYICQPVIVCHLIPGYRGYSVGFRVVRRSDPAPAGNQSPPRTESPKTLIDMVLVKGGSFMMGLDSGSSDEKPVHEVTLSPFYIGKYEVTQAQYRSVLGSNPSSFSAGNDAALRPVESVSWYDTAVFCNMLSMREGFSKVYEIVGSTVTADFSQNGYRLPTEAEWEYAARGGKQSKGYTYSGSNDIEQVAWYGDNSESTTHAAGTRAANELGLYDMTGNVWEWCYDWYGYYESGSQIGPTGASSNEYRVLRGGTWDLGADHCRSAIRGGGTPGVRKNHIGFRIVRRP